MDRKKISLISDADDTRIDILKNVTVKDMEIEIMDRKQLSGCDILVGFNLLGFERTSLTDNLSYNLLPCKQIHILTKKNLANEKYLAKQLSISMFFYCVGSDYYQYLSEKYPDIPYLKMISDWRDGEDKESVETNAETLSDIITEVMQICHMN